MKRNVIITILTIFLVVNAMEGQDKSKWPNGMSDDPAYFPLAVWLQDPADALKFKEVGINLYLGLWKGPTEEHLQLLKEAEMPVICELNEVSKKHLQDKGIIGWHAQPDEPDNAQPDGKGGYDPCVEPEKIISRYNDIYKVDATRPVYLGLGVGVAYHPYRGRGSKCGGDTTMYYDYCKGADIVGYDVYPMAGPPAARVKGQLDYVPYGVDNLRRWSNEKDVWMAMETARIRKHGSTPKAYQRDAEVWMAIIHGADGIIYFSHRMYPDFSPTGLLDDPEIKEAVRKLNTRIISLAPVINSPNIEGVVKFEQMPFDQKVDFMVKKYKNAYYIFAVEMNGERFNARFTLDESIINGKVVEVLGEDRKINIENGSFTDGFLQKGGYDVNIYKIEIDNDKPAYDHIYHDTFNNTKSSNWKANNPDNWEFVENDGESRLHLIRNGSFGGIRKPASFTILDHKDVTDFELTVEAKCDVDPAIIGRDMVILFGYQDSTHFYYTHISNSNHKYHNIIAIVDGMDRVPISHCTDDAMARLVDREWHRIKIRRNTKNGIIEVFVDDMETPIHSIKHISLTNGKIGLGSFDDHGEFRNLKLKYNLN